MSLRAKRRTPAERVLDRLENVRSGSNGLRCALFIMTIGAA